MFLVTPVVMFRDLESGQGYVIRKVIWYAFDSKDRAFGFRTGPWGHSNWVWVWTWSLDMALEFLSNGVVWALLGRCFGRIAESEHHKAAGIQWSSCQLFLPKDLPSLLSLLLRRIHILSEDFLLTVPFLEREKALEFGTDNMQVRLRFDCIQQKKNLKSMLPSHCRDLFFLLMSNVAGNAGQEFHHIVRDPASFSL